MSIADFLPGKNRPTTSASVKVAPLSDEEKAQLAECERIIGRHILSYAAVGQALATIRARQLYRTTYESFEAYVKGKWQMERAHAYRLMDAAEVAARLSPTGDMPQTERQARPLTRLEPEAQIAAWSEAKQLAGDEQPTAAHVAAAVEKRRPKKAKKGARKLKPIRLKVPGATIIIQPNRAFSTPDQALTAALNKLRGEEDPGLTAIEATVSGRAAA